MTQGDGRRDVTTAEAVAASILVLGAAAVLAAYFVYRAEWTIEPFGVLPVALIAAAVTLAILWRRAVRSRAETAAFAAVVAAIVGWLLWLARPDFMPIGGGVDIAHHLVLINYIDRHWQLVSHPDLVPYLGDMMDYTPGGHLLIALAAAWTGADVLRAVHPVLALTVAVKIGVVFLITLRLLPRDVPRVPLALTAVALLLVPLDYTIGAFTHDSFWAQVMAETFACAAWWTLVVWDAQPSRLAMTLFGVFNAATFVVWPIWIGPPVVALAVLVLARDGLSWRERITHATIGVAPLAAVAVIHMAGRVRWLGAATMTGGVIRPSAATLGWTFVIVSIAGLGLAATRREGRATALLAAAIVAQAATLFALAAWRGTDTPYLAYKMVYLLIYPCAAASALVVAALVRPTARYRPVAVLRPAWIIAALAIVLAARHAIAVTPSNVTVSEPVYLAGLWARANVDPRCVDYLVRESNTGYWLHLAVLDNPRSSPRMADQETFEPAKALERWIYPEGLPFAIVDDVSRLPRDIRESVEILARFGPAAVVKRVRPSVCP